MNSGNESLFEELVNYQKRQKNIINNLNKSSDSNELSDLDKRLDELLTTIQKPVDERSDDSISDHDCNINSDGDIEIWQKMHQHAHSDPHSSAKKEEYQYKITSSDDENDEYSEDSQIYDLNRNSVHDKNIPDWAQIDNLKKSLQDQKSVNPDKIFPVLIQKTVNLSEVFHDSKKKIPKQRGESGWWTNDAVTKEDIENYNKAQGYI